MLDVVYLLQLAIIVLGLVWSGSIKPAVPHFRSKYGMKKWTGR